MSGNQAWPALRHYAFRFWTAAVVLAGYAYAWVNRPEWLTGWKRLTSRAIEWACGLLPYPWGDRIEATLGNFGLWVQITLAIMLFRLVVGAVAGSVRWGWRRRHARPALQPRAEEVRRPPPRSRRWQRARKAD